MQTITHAITIDSNNHGATAETPAPALVMGQATEYALHLQKADGTSFDPPNIDGVSDWRFVLAGDFDQGTPNCLTASARYAGDGWFFSDVSESWTAEMVKYLGGAPYKTIQAEIVGIGADGETKSDWVFQFETYIRNRVDAIGHSAPSAITPYMTSGDLIAATVDYLDPILEGVESVSATVDTLATSAQAAAIQTAIGNITVDLTPTNNKVDAVQATVDTLATSGQFDTLMRAVYSDYSQLESGHTAIIENGTFGLVQLTNKVAAVQSAIGELATSAQANAIQTALETAPELTRGQILNILQNRSLAAVPASATSVLIPFDVETNPGYYSFVNWGTERLKLTLALPVRSITMGTGFFQNTTGVELLKLTQAANGGYGVTLPSFQNSTFRKVWIEQTNGAAYSAGPFTMGGGMFQNCGNLVAIKLAGLVNPFTAQLGNMPNLEYLDASDTSLYTSTSQSFAATTSNYYPKLKVLRAANVSQFSNNCFLACPNLEVVDMRTRTLTTVPTLTLNAVVAFHGLKFVIPDSLWTSWAEATSGNWYNACNSGYVVFEKASEYAGDDYSDFDWEGLDTL